MTVIHVPAEPTFTRDLNEDRWVNGSAPLTADGMLIEFAIRRLWANAHQYPSVTVAEEQVPAVIDAANPYRIPFQLMPYCNAIELWMVLDGLQDAPLKLTATVTGSAMPAVETAEFYGSSVASAGGFGGLLVGVFPWTSLLLEGFGANSGRAEVTAPDQDDLITLTNTAAGGESIHLYAYKLRQVFNPLLEQDH